MDAFLSVFFYQRRKQELSDELTVMEPCRASFETADRDPGGLHGMHYVGRARPVSCRRI